MGTNCELYPHGIQSEDSDLRAHVAVQAKMLYVFPTKDILPLLAAYPLRKAFQPGVDAPTALGHCVPLGKIPKLRSLAISPQRLVGFHRHLSTSEKGAKAVAVVADFLRAGRFPLPANAYDVKDVDLQISGVDIIVKGTWKIQVKCDYDAGRGKDGTGTGNLFLQVAERNPLRRI